MANRLTVVVLTHNDEQRIVDCLECLGFADEIVVIDDNSSDRTVELAEKFTKNIFIRQMNNNFSNQRNYALNQVHNPWVLFIDSDELVSEKLKEEIQKNILRSNVEGFYIKRYDYMWGKKILHGEAGNIKLLRLAKKESGKWKGKVHEKWKVLGDTDELSFPIIHVPHQTIKEFVEDINQYSSFRANELYEEEMKVSSPIILFYPLLKFVQNYILRKGYKDGVPGLLYAIMMSLHSFLVRAKLFLLINK